MVSIVEAALLLLLMVLSIVLFIGLYYFFKRTLPVEQRKKQSVVDKVEEPDELVVPLWIPWNWGGREGSTYDRSMPQYYPGPRPRPMGLGPRPIASETVNRLAQIRSSLDS
jgi:hypothetical protein